MRARRRLAKGIFFICILLLVSLPKRVAMAGEYASEKDVVLNQEIEMLKTLGEQAEDVGYVVLEKGIQILPYIGVVLCVFGVFVAVFSIRNKGNRRWGIKLAVTVVIVVYFLYISMLLLYDFVVHMGVIGLLERPEQPSVYENIYYNVLDRLRIDGQQFVLFEEGWQDDFVISVRQMYADIVGLLSFVSIGIGSLLLVVNKREKGFRRFAFAGMCVVIPATLMVGYQFLKM